jgi:hypothetical protein
MSSDKAAKDNVGVIPTKPTLDSKKKRRRQVLILLVILVALGATSLVAMLSVSVSFRAQFLARDEPSELKSMTDAKLACDKKLARKFEPLLQYATLNNIASRYDDDFGGYKLFYDVSVHRNKERNTGTNLVKYKCHILNNGYVRDTGVIQTTVTPDEASQKLDGNVFGF